MEYEANYSSTHEDSFRLGATQKRARNESGGDCRIDSWSGGGCGNLSEAVEFVPRIGKANGGVLRGLFEETVSVELPDAQLQEAYDWSRVSLLQGLVSNPTMGNGLVAGYRTRERASGRGLRVFWKRCVLVHARAKQRGRF